MLDHFLASIQQHSGYLMLGYGSLLSHCSRKQHSNIDSPALPVTLSGWQRSWSTRASHEQQTYVGATPKQDRVLNGVIFALQVIDEEFRLRERDYEFETVNIEHLDLHLDERERESVLEVLASFDILICKTLQPEMANAAHPVHQSYLDTCMQGCLDAAGEAFAKAFVEQTDGLPAHWLDDRSAPKYPRAALLSGQQKQKIDQLLFDMNLLQYRQKAVC